jgi:fumarylacetoacetate (FAA) hydrolase
MSLFLRSGSKGDFVTTYSQLSVNKCLPKRASWAGISSAANGFCFDLCALREHKCFAGSNQRNPMRLATILPRASLVPVPVVSAPDGTWIELAALTARKVNRLEDGLAWIMAHGMHLALRSAAWKGPRYRESEFEFLPPIVRPAAFRDFDAFEQHVKFTRRKLGLEMPQAWYDEPSFYFANRLALVGHEAGVCAPADSLELDFGLALGVIIGKRGRDISPEQAWQHIAGFTVVNDLSARDLERRSIPAGLGPSKGKDFATAMGPWIVPCERLADRIEGETLRLHMSACVNGQLLAESDTSLLYHSIPKLVAHASRDAVLFPGDLISTGASAGGCLMELDNNGSQAWLKPGDSVELEIERIGKLKTRIIARCKTQLRCVDYCV